MKSFQLVLITGSGIAVAVILSLVLTNMNLGLGNFQTAKIQKLVDYYSILHVHLPNEAGGDAGITTNNFDWSRDNKFAAFSMNAGAPVSYLYTISMDGREIKQIGIPIEFNYIENIHVSQDSSAIYFVGQYNNKKVTYQDIFRYDLNNNTYSFITKDSHVKSFDFMPDGNIVFSEGHYNSTRLESDRPVFLVRHYDLLWLATADGKKIRPLYNGTAMFSEMSASPDGRKILFESDEDPNHPSDNGTAIIKFGLSGGFEPNASYLASFDLMTKKFTILASSRDQYYTNPKWIDGDKIIYDVLLHQSVKDRAVGVESSPAGVLGMTDLAENSTRVLYGNQQEPYTAPLFGFALGPDGKSVIFGMNYDFSNGSIDGTGIYLLTFDKPLGDIS